MSNTHTPVDEEVEVTLKLKVKITQAYHSDQLSEQELKERTDEAKSKLKGELLNMVEDEFCNQALADMVAVDYKVENAEA